MDDQKLLQFYLALGGPEAGPWNLSPRSAYLEYRLRTWLEGYLLPSSGIEVCNIGIGVGFWDDFLGYHILGHGRLTSIEIDSEICEVFGYRQKREGHPNPARVLCMDILSEDIPKERFDFVTLIGSTASEAGDHERLLFQTTRLLKAGGFLFYSDFSEKHPAEKFRALSGALGVEILVHEEDARFSDMLFYFFLAKKR